MVQNTYQSQVRNPFMESIQGYSTGFKAGNEIRQLRDQRLAAQQAAMRQEELNTKIQTLRQNPNPQWDDYEDVIMLLPPDQKDRAEQFRKNFEARTKVEQDAFKKFTGQVTAALLSPNTESNQRGIDLLLRRAQAERESGNEEEAKGYELHAKAAQVNPRAVADELMIVGSSTIGKDWGEGIIKVREAPAQLEKLTAEAAIKKVEAEFAPEKLQTELNLSKEQLAAAKSKRLGEAAGIIPADKKPDYEEKLRKEYNTQSGTFRSVKDAYSRVLGSEDTPAGDIALIFNYMKMLDPGSVVREGEFATAQNAGGIPDRIWNAYNRALRGDRLNPNQRKMFTNQAKTLYGQAEKSERVIRDGISRIAKTYGLNTENVFYEAAETAPTPPAPPSASVPSAMGAATNSAVGGPRPSSVRSQADAILRGGAAQ